MAEYKTPGVYIEEISLLPPSIAEVETAIPAFIGYTQKAEKKISNDLLDKPTKIKSMLEYEQYFGYAEPEENIIVNVMEDYDSSGKLKSRTVAVPEPATTSNYLMYYNMQMFFANGGGQCYIISIGLYSASGAINAADLNATKGLKLLEKEDDPTLIVFPDATNLASSSDFYELYKAALTQCHKLQDRFTIIDTYPSDEDEFAKELRNGINLGTDYIKYGAAYYPYLNTTLKYKYKDTDVDVNISIKDATSKWT